MSPRSEKVLEDGPVIGSFMGAEIKKSLGSVVVV